MMVMEMKKPDFEELSLPAQFFSDRFFVGKASGETALRWAVLADGLRQYFKLAADPSAQGSPEFREEEGWILADDAEWPFSFVNLCEAFGLNPQVLRRVLEAWKSAHQKCAESLRFREERTATSPA